MTDMPTGQALLGKRALVLGIANEQSIAYGCAKVFRALGAELAVTYLNEKAKPYVAPLPEMDSRIFRPQSMGLRDNLLRVPLEQRFVYDPQQNVLFVNLSHFTVKTLEDVEQIRTTVAQRLSPLDRKVYAIVNYDGFRIDPDLIDPYFDRVKWLTDHFYSGVTRYTTSGFLRMKLGELLQKRGGRYGSTFESWKRLRLKILNGLTPAGVLLA